MVTVRVEGTKMPKLGTSRTATPFVTYADPKLAPPPGVLVSSMLSAAQSFYV